MKEEKIMIRKLGFTMILLPFLWSGAALGALEALEQVSEVSAAGISVPVGGVGQVVYRKCSGCEATVWPVNTATTYHIGTNTPPVSAADLRVALASKKYELIYVFYAPDSGIATRLILSLKKAEEK